MARPTVTKKCVADNYADKTDERIIEFTDGLPNGNGGLISLRRQPDERLRVEIYRADPGVIVVGPTPNREADEAAVKELRGAVEYARTFGEPDENERGEIAAVRNALTLALARWPEIV